MQFMQEIENLLKETYLKSQRVNSLYSLRAFAKSLGMPVSTLSEIMSGKRPSSKKNSQKICKALRLSDEQTSAILSTREDVKETKRASTDNYARIPLDSFYLISDWHYYAILQLIRTQAFKNSPKWIASRIGITTEEAKIALERLKRLKIITETNSCGLKDATKGRTTHLVANYTNEQLRNFQITALEKAIDTIKNVPIELRDNTSMTFAMNKSAMIFAKKEITKFRRQLVKKLELFDDPDEVYQILISLTPLTKI